MKTLYEVNWHYKADRFSHCTVTPITVLREGVLPGRTGVSITATNSSGQKFLGTPGDYFSSEEAAWDSIKADLLQTIECNDKRIEELKEENFILHMYLCGLPESKP